MSDNQCQLDDVIGQVKIVQTVNQRASLSTFFFPLELPRLGAHAPSMYIYLAPWDRGRIFFQAFEESRQWYFSTQTRITIRGEVDRKRQSFNSNRIAVSVSPVVSLNQMKFKH